MEMVFRRCSPNDFKVAPGWVFLPGALLWTYGMVLALILGGDSGMVSFVSDNWSAHWRQVWSLGEELLRAVPRP